MWALPRPRSLIRPHLALERAWHDSKPLSLLNSNSAADMIPQISRIREPVFASGKAGPALLLHLPTPKPNQAFRCGRESLSARQACDMRVRPPGHASCSPPISPLQSTEMSWPNKDAVILSFSLSVTSIHQSDLFSCPGGLDRFSRGRRTPQAAPSSVGTS